MKINIKDEINDILKELTDITGFEQNSQTLNAYYIANDKLVNLFERETKKYQEDCHWESVEDEETGKRYWSGNCNGDKDRTDLDIEEPIILYPQSFPLGYRVTGKEIVYFHNRIEKGNGSEELDS